MTIRDQKVYVGGLKLDSHIHTLNLRSSFEAVDNARLGDKTAVVCLGRGMTALQLSGYWNPTGAAAVDGQLFSDVGAERAYIIDVTGNGEGDVAYLGNTVVTARDLDLPHGKQGALSINGGTRDVIPVRGFLSEVSEGLGAGTVNGTGLNLGALAAGEKLYAVVCLHAGVAPDVDVVIESDDANTFLSPTTVATFANLTAEGGELVTAAGPITDTWYRAKVTVNSGSGIALAVAAGVL